MYAMYVVIHKYISCCAFFFFIFAYVPDTFDLSVQLSLFRRNFSRDCNAQKVQKTQANFCVFTKVQLVIFVNGDKLRIREQRILYNTLTNIRK